MESESSLPVFTVNTVFTQNPLVDVFQDPPEIPKSENVQVLLYTIA